MDNWWPLTQRSRGEKEEGRERERTEAYRVERKFMVGGRVDVMLKVHVYKQETAE